MRRGVPQWAFLNRSVDLFPTSPAFIAMSIADLPEPTTTTFFPSEIDGLRYSLECKIFPANWPFSWVNFNQQRFPELYLIFVMNPVRRGRVHTLANNGVIERVFLLVSSWGLDSEFPSPFSVRSSGNLLHGRVQPAIIHYYSLLFCSTYLVFDRISCLIENDLMYSWISGPDA